ncbi:MAG: glycosyltransferase family 39 protein [Anaerolineaceae bacterium]|nr:glycosyltransferase family 39 protein [Anaerolineaceae bacterium]
MPQEDFDETNMKPEWRSQWPVVVAFLLILGGFLALASPLAVANIRSSDWDQRDYLKIALWVSEGGAFTDSNRNPLYPLLLVPFASEEIAFFTSAKLISMLLGLLGLGVVFGVGWRVVGRGGALLVIGLLAVTAVYLEASAYVNVEVLLVTLFVTAWYAGARALVAQAPARWFALAGVLAGLCYLAKGTGLLLVPMMLGTLILQPFTQFAAQSRWRWLRQPGSWLFLAAFVLVAAPLWLYNLRTHDSLLYNINTTHYIWLDSWEESYVYPGDPLPTSSSYLQTHTIAHMAERLWNGLGLLPNQWYEAVRPFFFSDALGWGTAVTAIGLSMVVLVGWTTRKKRPALWPVYLYTLLGILASVLLFSWYHPISDGPRFVLPWTAIMFMGAVWWFKEFIPLHWSRLLDQVIHFPVGVAFLLILALNWREAGTLSGIYSRDQQANESSVAVMNLVKQRTPAGGMFILGPTHAQAEWLAHDRHVQAIPHARPNWASFQTLLLNENVTTVVLDEESWQRRQQLLGEFWELTAEGLRAETLPPGWTLLAPDAFPCRTCVFGVDAQPYWPRHPAALTYAHTFSLTGYSLEPSAPSANEPLTLYTHWQLQAQFRETTHYFIHVLDESGQLVSQDDGPFLVDFRFYPEAVFLSGTNVRLVHQLPALPAGDYEVYIGLYQWETQERLPTQTGETYPLLLDWQLR